MSGWSYGEYAYFCRNIPSVATCNLFFRQFFDPNQVSGVGIDSSCAIPNLQSQGLGNIANMILCGLSILLALYLSFKAFRRIAAVGRIEIALLFVVYALTAVFQLLSEGSFLTQGRIPIVWITAIHEGLVVALFWILLWTAILALQFVEDGRIFSYLPMLLPALALFIGTTYISLDTAFSISNYFDTSLDDLQSAWLFTLTIIWPAVAILVYYVINVLVIQRVLQERKPLLLFTATLVVFALAQGARYGLSHTICKGTDAKLDGSFLGTLLETAALYLLWESHKSITEDQFDDYSVSGVGLTS